ncbi:MAG: NAD(P)H-hydrate dehydratase [Bacillota bacterium]
MKVLTNQQMKTIEKIAMDDYKIPSIVMMENAAYSVLNEILDVISNKQEVLIFCGTGNNGGDGFALSRLLTSHNIENKVIILGDIDNIKKNALLNLNILKANNTTIKNVKSDLDLKKIVSLIKSDDLIVDAIFGTGLNRPVKGIYKKTIQCILNLKNYIISIDIPSGINGNNGHIEGVAVEADRTVTMFLPKFGNVLFPGAQYNGKLIIGDIGIFKEIISDLDLKNNLIKLEMIKKFLPKREQNSHKGTYGKAFIIAGSIGLTGAAILTCKAALKSGIGLLKLYIPESVDTVISSNIAEVITKPLKEARDGIISLSSIDEIIKDSKNADVIAIGPGCTNTNELKEIVKRFINKYEKTLVLDADGLNALSKEVSLLNNRVGQTILTPHLGEMSRLIDKSVEYIEKNKISVAKEFSQKYNVILVLKGARTIISRPNGNIYINLNGNSGMATAGTGDVLTGIITSFVAQGIESWKACILGVFIHGYTGDYMVEKKGKYGLVAGDLVDGVGKVLKELS